ncbi:MAG: hypothetical protein APF76_10795 [Desulfitibacter sp. BRH_c19]|nr:MAG: hypothetical protein APF76_10795 [Desulfitibacter sp. BRH_c19]
MNKFLCMLMIMILLFSPVIIAQDETNDITEENITQEEVIPKEESTEEESTEEESTPTQSNENQIISWEAMNEMQTALFIINKQIDYLMERIEDSDTRIRKITDTYEERLEKEIARNKELAASYEEKIESLEQEIVVHRDNLSQLERDNAIFASESGLYLKILIGFLVGSIFGIVLAGLLQLWKKGKNSKNKSASA